MRHYSDLELTELLLKLGANPEKVDVAVAYCQSFFIGRLEDPVLDRRQAASQARKLFVWSEITKSISEAFELYQRYVASRERPKAITKGHQASQYSAIPKRLRPICKECGVLLRLRLIKTPRGKANKKGWKSCWVCPECLSEEYSEKSIGEWLIELHKKDIELQRAGRKEA